MTRFMLNAMLSRAVVLAIGNYCWCLELKPAFKIQFYYCVSFLGADMEIIFCSKNVSFVLSSETICRNFSSADDILLAKIGPKRRSLSITVILLSIYSMIFMTGLIGNVCTCIVIIRTSYMRTSTNYYLFSLALSDVILLIVGT